MRAWWWVGFLGALWGCAGMDGSGVSDGKGPSDPVTVAPPADGGTGGGEQSACADGQSLPVPTEDTTLQRVSAGGHLVLYFQDFAARYAARGQPASFPANGGHYFFSEDGTRAYSGRPFWGYGGGGGEVYELDALTGTQTVIFDATFPEVTADEAAQLIAARSESGRLVLYDVRSRQRQVVSQAASSLGFPVGEHWAFDARGQLQLWHRRGGDPVVLGGWSRAEPVGDALLYVDTQGQLFGWSEAGGAQALGRAEAAPVLTGHRAIAEGGLALIDADGVAWAWRFLTGQVRRLAAGAHAVAISADADRVAVASTSGLELFSVGTGTRTPVLAAAPEAMLAFDTEGTRLAAAVREDGRWRISLVDVATGAVTPAADVPPQLPQERVRIDFSPDGSLLRATPAGEAQSLYDAATGALVYRSRLAVASSGTYSHWFDGNLLLLRQGAHMGPPDQALYAFDGGRHREEKVAEGSRLDCFQGPAVFLEFGLSRSSDAPGGIAAWTKDGGAEVFSGRARAARCTEQGDAVLFLDAPLDPLADGRPGPGTLRQAAPGAPARTFASGVEHFVVGADHVAWRTAQEACVAPLSR